MKKVNYETQYVSSVQEFFSYAQKGYFEISMSPFLKAQVLRVFNAKDFFKENEFLWYVKLLLETQEEKQVLFAKEILKTCVEENHPLKGTLLGEYYYQIHNYPLAYGCFLLSAHQNDAKAEYYMGIISLKEENIKPNKKLAITWLTRASEHGYPKAAYALAKLHLDRKKPSYILAKKYANIAFKTHVLESYDLLGMLYLEGKGYKKDVKKAFYFFFAAAKQDEPMSMYHLGYCYKYGLGTKKDLNSMIYWYKKASEKQEPHALYELGLCYLWGMGTHIDYKKAYYLFKLGKEESLDCAIEFARLYEEGRGVKKDVKKAFSLYLKLTKAKMNKSYLEVGRCYLLGIGTKKNMSKAIRFLLKAQKEGVKGSQKLLKHYYLSYKGKEKEEKKIDYGDRTFLKKEKITSFKIKNFSESASSTLQSKKL